MTSFTTRLGGYLKQLVGEVVGSPALHEKGKREVVGAADAEPAQSDRLSDADAARVGSPPLRTDARPAMTSGRHASTAGGIHADFERGLDLPPSRKEKIMPVYTQLLPEIEPGSGPYVKVSSQDNVLYVAISEGDPFKHAKEVVIRMAEGLTAKPERAAVPAGADARDERRSAETPSDLEDELEIGLEDSFPASDPPAAVTRSTLPKKHTQ